MSDILDSSLGVAILSLLIGVLITAVVTKLLGKTARLTYSTRTDRLALAANDPIFGSVKVTWRDKPVRNLHMVSLTIENSSSHDFEDVDLKIYTGNETFLLSERTSIENTPFIVTWSDEFRERLAVAPQGAPTPEQMREYNHSREYRVPVLNRGQVLHFTYLCTRPGDDAQPAVFVSTLTKGAKLVYQVRLRLIHGVPVQFSAVRGSVVSFLVVVACGLWLQSIWIASAISMSVGLFAQSIGAVQYKGERWLRRLIAG